MMNALRMNNTNRRIRMKAVLVTFLASLLLATLAEAIPTPGVGGSSGGIVLRVRLADGSMEKLQLEEGSEETLTLGIHFSLYA